MPDMIDSVVALFNICSRSREAAREAGPNILAVVPGMQMGPSEALLRYLANLTGAFREGGQQAVYDSLREKGEQIVCDNR
jgi:hypothetical protein